MNWKLFFVLTFASQLAAVSTIRASEEIRAAQARLEKDGYYHGAVNGNYNSDTAAAITRYQIRNGLAISGKLDASTAQALGVKASAPNEKAEAPDAATWRQLRQSDERFLAKLNACQLPPPRTPTPHPEATSVPIETVKHAQIEPHGPPPPAPEAPPPAPPTPPPVPVARSSAAPFDREQMRDYIGAFVLAGLDPQIGAELEFFAPRVDYFGKPNVSHEKIREDLRRYDRRWPERHFTLAGDLTIQPLSTDRVRISFPLRYELRGPDGHAAGRVQKTLTLQHNATGAWEIVAVNEEKAPRRG